MENLAGWVAPIATMIAAMMTAANLGPRFTGWGFVVFLVGSIAWSTVGFATGQQNLLLTNIFLSLVNGVGIWRWLGREARLGDGARSARHKAGREAVPDLFAISGIEGRPLIGADGQRIGEVAGAMAECDSGRLAYLVVRFGGMGGVGEEYRGIDWGDARAKGDAFRTDLDAAGLKALPPLDPADWPARL